MEIPTVPVNESLESIKKLSVEELKNILRNRGQPVTGKKADLVLRCHALFQRQKTREKTPNNGLPEQENVPLLPVTSSKKSADITYESLLAEAVDCVWATDLNQLPLLYTLRYTQNTNKDADPEKHNNGRTVLFLLSQNIQDDHSNYALQQLEYKNISIKIQFNSDVVVVQDCHKISIIIKLHRPKHHLYPI